MLANYIFYRVYNIHLNIQCSQIKWTKWREYIKSRENSLSGLKQATMPQCAHVGVTMMQLQTMFDHIWNTSHYPHPRHWITAPCRICDHPSMLNQSFFHCILHPCSVCRYHRRSSCRYVVCLVETKGTGLDCRNSTSCSSSDCGIHHLRYQDVASQQMLMLPPFLCSKSAPWTRCSWRGCKPLLASFPYQNMNKSAFVQRFLSVGILRRELWLKASPAAAKNSPCCDCENFVKFRPNRDISEPHRMSW